MAGRLWQEGSRTPSWSPLVQAALSVGCAGWLVQADEPGWEEIVQAILRGTGQRNNIPFLS